MIARKIARIKHWAVLSGYTAGMMDENKPKRRIIREVRFPARFFVSLRTETGSRVHRVAHRHHLAYGALLRECIEEALPRVADRYARQHRRRTG